MNEKIGIIIPAYNEEKRISKILEDYCTFFRKNKENFELIVVLNNCHDNTSGIVKKIKKKFKEIVILDFKQGGKGFAIAEGFKEALKRNCDFIGFVDADMATGAEAFYDLLKNLENQDGIIANRYHKKSVINPKQPLDRIIASRGFNVLVRLLFLFKFKDTQCGAKIFKKKVVERILPNLSITQWAFDIDLLYQTHKSNFKIKEHPTIWSDIGGSKINLQKSSLQMFLAVCRLRAINSRFK